VDGSGAFDVADQSSASARQALTYWFLGKRRPLNVRGIHRHNLIFSPSWKYWLGIRGWGPARRRTDLSGGDADRHPPFPQ